MRRCGGGDAQLSEGGAQICGAARASFARCSDDAPDFFLTDAAKALRDGHMTLPKHRGMPYGGPLCSGSDRLMLEPLPREMDVPWCFRQTFDWDSSRTQAK